MRTGSCIKRPILIYRKTNRKSRNETILRYLHFRSPCLVSRRSTSAVRNSGLLKPSSQGFLGHMVGFAYMRQCERRTGGATQPHYSGIEFGVDTELSHSIHEGGSVDTQAACGAIGATDAALACGKRPYDFLALLPLILLGASTDIMS
jgi:hypothetical protein